MKNAPQMSDFYPFSELVPDSALKDYPTIRRSHTHVTNAELRSSLPKVAATELPLGWAGILCERN